MAKDFQYSTNQKPGGNLEWRASSLDPILEEDHQTGITIDNNMHIIHLKLVLKF
jgi:hypothetical protein